MNRDELEQFMRDAEKALDAMKKERDDKVREAKFAIEDEYAGLMHDLGTAFQAAKEKLRVHISTATAHPWDGKRVFQIKPVYSRWSNQTIGEERIEGIVEVVRLDSRFPANLRWGRPELGSVIIRKVKKDGKPSLQIEEQFRLGNISDTWQLAEG